MSLLTIYIWGVALTFAYFLYVSYVAREEGDNFLSSDDPDMPLAIAIAVLLISIFWPISVPYTIAVRLCGKSDD